MTYPLFYFQNVAYQRILSIDKMEINPYEVTCIVGESGGGKSTILKLLNKSISPTKGTIYYHDKDLADVDSITHRRKVLYLSQKPYMFKGTIKDNLIVGFNMQGITPPKDETLEALLDKLKLKKRLNDDAQYLSGGEAQRVALARLLLLDGDVYLLDEPSSALDDKSAGIIFETIVDFSLKHQKTLVMITHTKAIANQYAHKIYTIDQGHISKEEDNG